MTAPRFSVVVCTFNGAKTIRDCLAALAQLDYPNYEVIVVNDGSTDETERIVQEYNVRLITTTNEGLSRARNVGREAATGEFVAYIDDDAYPDQNWLCYLADSFARTNHVAIGGPNVEPPDDSLIATCVANAPGGPVHVLLSDELAEHLPGCNIAFRKSALEAISGFDPSFRVAGDDVDVCWRLQERGGTLGFSPAAMVWHHARDSVRKYWQQQRGYGRAEALLDAKWPGKFNSAGHHTLRGRIYGKGFGHILRTRAHIYHGVWGSAPCQFLYQQSAGTLESLPTMPEWYLIIGLLAVISALGWSWLPFFAAIPLLVFATLLTISQAWRGATRAFFGPIDRGGFIHFQLCVMTVFLHLTQPLARLLGRVEHGLTFWRRRGDLGFVRPQKCEIAHWSEDWIEPATRVGRIESALRAQGAIVLQGSAFSRWDLEVRGGMFGAARLLMAVEDHGGGTQYVRCRVWPRFRRAGIAAVTISAFFFVAAVAGSGWFGIIISGVVFALFLSWTILQIGAAVAACTRATEDLLPQKR
jgi:GT2 family glycosyltransferase